MDSGKSDTRKTSISFIYMAWTLGNRTLEKPASRSFIRHGLWEIGHWKNRHLVHLYDMDSGKSDTGKPASR
ncbi:Hypothetical predicted protein [Octopus vulgaris]|uniref:Uncharacterized protein n=1 Tax=Octopus vulgaris TaxID=6645 RepID=A0AA36BAV5_OCTVU|nr:Hypothetical predicted protein [Octopus vulgaris]